jgi:hypothetical protein
MMLKFWSSNLSHDLIRNYINSLQILAILKRGFKEIPTEAKNYIEFEENFLVCCEEFHLPLRLVSMVNENENASFIHAFIPKQFHSFLSNGIYKLNNYLKLKEKK